MMRVLAARCGRKAAQQAAMQQLVFMCEYTEGAERHRHVQHWCPNVQIHGEESSLLSAQNMLCNRSFEARPDGRSRLRDAIYSLVMHQRSHLPSQQ